MTLYQPTTFEISALWPTLRPDDPWNAFYSAARRLLQDVRSRFGYNDLHWIIVDRSESHRIDARITPPLCACSVYNSADCMEVPRGKSTPVRYCAGTLAFVAYRQILAERYDGLSAQSRPAHIRHTFWRGLCQPLTPTDVYNFSTWLAERPYLPATNLAPMRKEVYQ
jgi:hypothetical protein